MKKATQFIVSGMTIATLAACDGSNSNDSNEPSMSTLSISSLNLEALGDDFNYEGWIIVDGKAISAGIFDIKNGAPSPSSFELNSDELAAATKYVLTIEPEVDTDPNPSEVHIIAGDISNGIAMANTADAAAIGTDFADAAGTFIFATPSNGNATPNQGIWFLDNSNPPPVASLTLPTLAAGWTYEGWVVVDGTPYSTGLFTDPNMADSDGAGPAAGPMPTPNYPGQDFIDPALDLSDAMVVISVEPVPDNSPAPFSIKPLLAESPDKTLSNISASNLPSAVITISQ